MAVRSLDQVLAELATSYDPQINSIRQRQSLIPGEIAAEEQGLKAQQGEAFDEILGGARRRGLGFAGIPMSEQAKYTSTQFLPALARLKQGAREKALSLEDAILGIQERRNNVAQQMRQGDVENDFRERNFEFEKQKFGEQMAAQRRAEAEAAASRRAASSGFGIGAGGNQGGEQGSSYPAGMTPRSDALGKFTGFNFTGSGGKPVSAAQFAAQNKVPVGDLLYQMGQAGDATAQRAYNWVKSIQGTDLWKSGRWTQTPAYKQGFSSLFWGT